MTSRKTLLTLIYLINLIIHLLSNIYYHAIIRTLTKVIITPSILMIYLELTKHKKRNKLVILGITFGFIGDVLMIFYYDITLYLSLLTFFLGHFFYIIQLYKDARKFNKQLYLALFLITLGLISYKLIYLDHVTKFCRKEFLIPGFIYMEILVVFNGLSWFTLLLKPCIENLLLCIGTVVFICSDYMVSKSTMLGEVFNGNFLVMLTYSSAQTCIVFSYALKE